MKLYSNLILLLLMTLVILNLTLIQDGPGALQHNMLQEFGISTYTFSLLYSVTLMPGIFAFLSGYIVDRYDGLQVNTYASVVIVNVGCIMYAIGCYQKHFVTVLIGRLIFGVSFTAMYHSINCYKLLCFGGDGILNVAFAITNSVPWLGSSIVFFVSTRLQIFASKYASPTNALNIAYAVPCLSSAIFVSIFMLLIVWMYRSYHKLHVQEDQLNDTTMDKEFDKITDTLKAPALFWTLILVAFFGYSIIINLIMMSQDLFINEYNLNLTDSSNMSSLLCILISVISPLIGYIIGRFGYNLSFATAGSLFSTLGHGLPVLTSLCPIWFIVFLSLSYAFTAASVWPVIDIIVKKNQTARACGIAQSVLCFYMTTGAMTAGFIIDKYTYRGLEIIYFILSTCILPLWLLVWIMDIKTGGVLNMSRTQRSRLKGQL